MSLDGTGVGLDKMDSDTGVRCLALRESRRERLIFLLDKQERLKTSKDWPEGLVVEPLLMGRTDTGGGMWM